MTWAETSAEKFSASRRLICTPSDANQVVGLVRLIARRALPDKAWAQTCLHRGWRRVARTALRTDHEAPEAG
jgi:hypothetical protein